MYHISTYIVIILLSFFSGLTTLIGVELALRFKYSVKGIITGIGFSAGIMLLISFFELIPKSIVVGGIPNTAISVCLGIILVGALNFIIPHTHLDKEKGKIDSQLLKSTYLIAFGLILHDLPEGFAMANSYIHSPTLGLLIAVAIAIHNIPEEFAMAVPIVAVKKKKFLLYAAIFSGLAEPAGAIMGLIAVNFMPTFNQFLMSFAAGTMIFVSIHELFPMAKRYKKISFFTLGIILSVFVFLALTMLIPE